MFEVVTAPLIHELGHIIAIKLCGGRIRSFRLTFSGAVIDAELCALDSSRRAIVYAAGAAANIISGFIGLFFGIRGFAAVSFLLALVNLLPIRMLDGGCLIHELIGHESAFLDILSRVTMILIWLSAIVILTLTGNVSLWIFASYLFCEMYLRGL